MYFFNYLKATVQPYRVFHGQYPNIHKDLGDVMFLAFEISHK